jgi:hypothetical protein
MSNSFTLTQTIPGTYDCPFFGTIPSGTYAGGDSDCGTAINYCAALNLASGGTSNTDWFLPSQKVLFQAYIDGMLNQTNSSFALTDKEPFWSSTETSGYNGNPGIAWAIALYDGSSYAASKPDINRYRVRCVRRD